MNDVMSLTRQSRRPDDYVVLNFVLKSNLPLWNTPRRNITRMWGTIQSLQSTNIKDYCGRIGQCKPISHDGRGMSSLKKHWLKQAKTPQTPPPVGGSDHNETGSVSKLLAVLLCPLFFILDTEIMAVWTFNHYYH